jgi:hypothetical protein
MAGDERQPHVARWSRTLGPVVRENAFTHTPNGVVWDSGSRLMAGAYYPLKPHA